MSSVTILGFGYVGQELAKVCLESDYKVQAYDPDPGKKDSLIFNDLIAKFQNLFLSSDISKLKKTDYYVICVPTPLTDNNEIDLSYIKDASELAGNLISRRDKAVLILESTSYPGTVDNVIIPILKNQGLEVGHDVLIGFSPERVDPGNSNYGFKNTPKIVSGINSESELRVKEFYDSICERVVVASTPRAAEAAKLLENTYRLINISFINEFSMLISSLGLDPIEIIELANTKPYGFSKFLPSLGVGGHCIPVDPAYLQFAFEEEIGKRSQFIEIGFEINRKMIDFQFKKIVDLIDSKSCKQVVILGLTYKPDVLDFRESPALNFLEKINYELEVGNLSGIKFFSSDPNISELLGWKFKNIEKIDDKDLEFKEFDLAYIAQNHAKYTKTFLEKISKFYVFPF